MLMTVFANFPVVRPIRGNCLYLLLVQLRFLGRLQVFGFEGCVPVIK